MMTAAASQALDLQGHRGARGLAPENTLPAFAVALGIGVTTLEMDCAITRDGVVVVSHDPALNPDIARGPDGKWLEKPGPAIWNLTFNELQRYDVGRTNPAAAYAKRWPEQRPADGTRIPRLADVFSLVRKSGNEAVRFNIETKISPLDPDQTTGPEDFARKLVAAIREGGMARRATIQSFDWRTLQIVQKEAPEIATVYLTTVSGFIDTIQPKGESQWTAGLRYRDHGSVPRMIKAAGGAIWSPYQGDLTRETVKEAQALGLKVVVWTVNAPADMRRMIEWGVPEHCRNASMLSPHPRPSRSLTPDLSPRGREEARAALLPSGEGTGMREGGEIRGTEGLSSSCAEPGFGIISDYPDVLRKVAGEMGVALPRATPIAY